MPAFAESTGGTLTDKQIDVIVSGIRSWAKPGTIGGELPPYTTGRRAILTTELKSTRRTALHVTGLKVEVAARPAPL